MSFDRLSVTESQPTTMRRQDDPEYRDDPEFSRFTEDLSVKLFSLTSNVSRLSQQVKLLGTKRDTERVRERVHDLLGESRDGFKEAGEGIKRLMSWEDLNVSFTGRPIWSIGSAIFAGFAEVYTAKAFTRVSGYRYGVSEYSEARHRETTREGIRDQNGPGPWQSVRSP